MVEGIFKKIKKTFVGSNEIEVYGGDKGNFGYIYFIDSKTRDVMSLLVNPPASKARVVGGKVAAAGIETEAQYASSKSYRGPLAFINIDATPKVKRDEITSKMNEYNKSVNQSEISSSYVQNVGKDDQIIVGSYRIPITQNPENPVLESHFDDELQISVQNGLKIFPEYVIKNYWHDRKIFRSNIFLHNAVKKELKMHVGYNMSDYIDDMIAFPEGSGTVGMAFNSKRPLLADFAVTTHEERGVDPAHIWPDLRSILAVPILDNNNVPLGTLCVDSDQRYTDAGFDDPSINNLLILLSRGIGRLLEGYSI